MKEYCERSGRRECTDLSIHIYVLWDCAWMCEWKHSKFEMLMIHIYTNTISFSMGNFSFHRMSEGNPFILFEWWTQSLTEQIGLSSSKNGDAQYNSGKRPKRQSILSTSTSQSDFFRTCVYCERETDSRDFNLFYSYSLIGNAIQLRMNQFFGS